MKFNSFYSGRHLFKLVHLKNQFWKGFANVYYSQSGEDIIIGNFFQNKNKGFFVDVGAYHPKHYSNTYLLYKNGWRGINIEPNPASIKLFNKYRKNDINLQTGVLNENKEADYHIFNHQSCNTFSKDQKETMEKKSFIKIVDKIKINCLPMRDILRRHLPPDTQIDLLNIDVEGLDLEVLQSNDWSKFKPKVIIVEGTSFNFDCPNDNPIYSFLKKHSYNLYASTGLSLVFARGD